LPGARHNNTAIAAITSLQQKRCNIPPASRPIPITPHRRPQKTELAAKTRAMVANGQMPAQRQPPEQGQLVVLRLTQDPMCFFALHMITPDAPL